MIPPELMEELDAVVVADIHDDDFNLLLQAPSVKRAAQELEESSQKEAVLLDRGARQPQLASRVARVRLLALRRGPSRCRRAYDGTCERAEKG
jgi:hypothetical protein